MRENEVVNPLGNFQILADGGDDAMVVHWKGGQIGIGDFEHGYTYLGRVMETHGSHSEPEKVGERMEMEIGSKCALGSKCAPITFG